MKMLRIGLLVLFVACVAWPVAATASQRSGQRVGGASANSTTFTDPTGDSGNAPDITTTTVSNDDNGQLTWSATMSNRPTLTDKDVITISVDTNGNLSDNRRGAEYMVSFIKGIPVKLDKLLGNAGTVDPASSFSASYANGVATFSVNVSQIDNPTQINFQTVASGDNRVPRFPESAPDSGWWNYKILISSGGGPTGPTGSGGTPPVKLAETKPVVKGAVAGKTVSVSAVVTNNGTGVRATSVTCSGKVAGKSLRGARSGRTASGKISCSWRLPSSGHGKSLTGKIGASYQGRSVSKPFVAKIKSQL
jgi:hypothetical protein